MASRSLTLLVAGLLAGISVSTLAQGVGGGGAGAGAGATAPASGSGSAATGSAGSAATGSGGSAAGHTAMGAASSGSASSQIGLNSTPNKVTNYFSPADPALVGLARGAVVGTSSITGLPSNNNSKIGRAHV